ncbi:MAG: hypothetical protein DRJ64_03695 [Thermoprotei archaeon]|nr:MAG: hypothetical protein DRJ64_03695 [Thermoprotei archaeon]
MVCDAMRGEKWCVYWWKGRCWLEGECAGAQLFPLQNADAEVLAEVLDEREKRYVREVYEVIKRGAVPNNPMDRLQVAECNQARELAEYWLRCWYFKEEVRGGEESF